jgi:glycine oxidase
LTHNVVIIGAGVSGLSAALTLLQRGHRVTVLERGQMGRESSWAGGGILSPLLPWDYPAAVSGLALPSMAAYPDWVAQIETLSGLNAEYWRCGMRLLDYAQPDRARAWCAAHGMACEVAGADVWLPGIAQVRNPRLLKTLAQAVVALGGRIVEHAEVVGLRIASSRATTVLTAAAEYAADQIVITTGAWAGIEMPGLPAAPHIEPVRGQMLLYQLPTRAPTILYRDGVYLIPRRDGHVLVGSTLEHAGFDTSTTADARAMLHAAATTMLPALADMQPIRHWSGLRPGAPDNIPLIDRHPAVDNVWLNVGHFRYGVTMAPASAALLADMIEGKPPALDPEPYRWQAASTRCW